ncbi:MAG: GspE/PulE family protein [Oscillospiraceae bacterium]|nr:GspE/PulE family protein [Oscillospiraceae bacterium]
MGKSMLEDVLVSCGELTREQLTSAAACRSADCRTLAEALAEQGLLSERRLAEILENELGIETVDLASVRIAPSMAELLPVEAARRLRVVPIETHRGELIIAAADPLDIDALAEVRRITGMQTTPRLAQADDIGLAISALYGSAGTSRALADMQLQASSAPAEAEPRRVFSLDAEGEAPAVRFVSSVIKRAVLQSASDIHIEPHRNELAVRMRIDGRLRDVLSAPEGVKRTVVSRIKVMAGMDIAEHRVPQDGRASVSVGGEVTDLRISIVPTIHGEKAVIRLLGRSSKLLEPEAIGLSGRELEQYRALLHGGSGMVLLCGPTGSGKTTTMYAMLRELGTPEVNTVTLEDPVEYSLAGVNQVQINEKTGMTFAAGLRAVLRQDPDIIAVGEIRDGETAEIAMRAALTGHTVLSTVHTRSAVDAIDRLLDIGVEPYIIASALRGVISQRLVRRICPACREMRPTLPEKLAALRLPPETQLWRGRGCPRCGGTGYAGRIGCFEILTLTDETRRLIARAAPRAELLAAVRAAGFTPMRESALRLAASGVTTIEEAMSAAADVV